MFDTLVATPLKQKIQLKYAQSGTFPAFNISLYTPLSLQKTGNIGEFTRLEPPFSPLFFLKRGAGGEFTDTHQLTTNLFTFSH